MSKPVVLLDPGHGGYDPGAVYNGLKEKDLNLVLALKVAEKLDGLKVLLTRERDIYVSLADRVALSRRAEPNLFLSLHANAGGGRGFESFIYSGLGERDPALWMQKAVHQSIMRTLGRWEIVDRGMKKAAFYVLRHNPAPAVLIESLFIDNTREAAIWREPVFVSTLAASVAGGIKTALGLEKEELRKSQPDIPSTLAAPATYGVEQDIASSSFDRITRTPEEINKQALYTVQVGAFAFVENARQRLAEARRAGFSDAYIYQKQF